MRIKNLRLMHFLAGACDICEQKKLRLTDVA